VLPVARGTTHRLARAVRADDDRHRRLELDDGGGIVAGDKLLSSVRPPLKPERGGWVPTRTTGCRG